MRLLVLAVLAATPAFSQDYDPVAGLTPFVQYPHKQVVSSMATINQFPLCTGALDDGTRIQVFLDSTMWAWTVTKIAPTGSRITSTSPQWIFGISDGVVSPVKP